MLDIDIEDRIYIIEYNWRRRYFHFEPLDMRMVKNLLQIMRNKRPYVDSWVPVCVCRLDDLNLALEALKVAFDLDRRSRREQKRNKKRRNDVSSQKP